MTTLYLILLIASALCFAFAAFLATGAGRAEGPAPGYTRLNFLALGLLLWVLVPLIQTARNL